MIKKMKFYHTKKGRYPQVGICAIGSIRYYITFVWWVRIFDLCSYSTTYSISVQSYMLWTLFKLGFFFKKKKINFYY
jgi:hypothetical protein